MAIGLARAGYGGALAAWLGFTLPSAIALILFAWGVAGFSAVAQSGAVQGLKVVAVAVVAQAVWAMARSLCPDRLRAGFAIVAAMLVLVAPALLQTVPGLAGVSPAVVQIMVIVLAGLFGHGLLDLPAEAPTAHRGFGVSRRAGWIALFLFAVLATALAVWAVLSDALLGRLLDGVFRAGALVFGGGHVVLPLLQSAVVPTGAISNADFLAGYGAAQAVPGPLFSFAAYLGAAMSGPAIGIASGWLAGLLFLVVIFLPAFLLLIGALPFWDALRARTGVRCAVAGVNAAVVGILLAALYDPVWTATIHSKADFALALAAFGLLVVARLSPVLVVLLAAAAGWFTYR